MASTTNEERSKLNKQLNELRVRRNQAYDAMIEAEKLVALHQRSIDRINREVYALAQQIREMGSIGGQL